MSASLHACTVCTVCTKRLGQSSYVNCNLPGCDLALWFFLNWELCVCWCTRPNFISLVGVLSSWWPLLGTTLYHSLSSNFHQASGCQLQGQQNFVNCGKKGCNLNLDIRHSSERHQGPASNLRKVSEKDLEVCWGESSGPHCCHQAKKWTTFKILTCHQVVEKNSGFTKY